MRPTSKHFIKHFSRTDKEISSQRETTCHKGGYLVSLPAAFSAPTVNTRILWSSIFRILTQNYNNKNQCQARILRMLKQVNTYFKNEVAKMKTVSGKPMQVEGFPIRVFCKNV